MTRCKAQLCIAALALCASACASITTPDGTVARCIGGCVVERCVRAQDGTETCDRIRGATLSQQAAELVSIPLSVLPRAVGQ